MILFSSVPEKASRNKYTILFTRSLQEQDIVEKGAILTNYFAYYTQPDKVIQNGFNINANWGHIRNGRFMYRCSHRTYLSVRISSTSATRAPKGHIPQALSPGCLQSRCGWDHNLGICYDCDISTNMCGSFRMAPEFESPPSGLPHYLLSISYILLHHYG